MPFDPTKSTVLEPLIDLGNASAKHSLVPTKPINPCGPQYPLGNGLALSFKHMKSKQQVDCYVRATGTPSEADDESLPGWYIVTVGLSGVVDLHSLSDAQKSEIAAAVLDEFHEKQGVELLDDFDFDVYLVTGLEIYEDTNTSPTGLVTGADHGGSVNESDLPFKLAPVYTPPPRSPQSFDAIVDVAKDAFWLAIAKGYPQVKTGDLPPETVMALETAMKDAVDVWLSSNASAAKDLPIEVGAVFKSRATGAHFEVIELPYWEVRFAPKGGGFVRRMSRLAFIEKFAPVTEEDVFVPGLFEVADGPYAVPGYSKPRQRWNGWAIPYFTKAGADFLMAKFPTLSYDAEQDAFIEQDPSFDEPAVFAAVEIEVPGKGKEKAYPIGGGWVWVRYEDRSALPDSEIPNIDL